MEKFILVMLAALFVTGCTNNAVEISDQDNDKVQEQTPTESNTQETTDSTNSTDAVNENSPEQPAIVGTTYSNTKMGIAFVMPEKYKEYKAFELAVFGGDDQRNSALILADEMTEDDYEMYEGDVTPVYINAYDMGSETFEEFVERENEMEVMTEILSQKTIEMNGQPFVEVVVDGLGGKGVRYYGAGRDNFYSFSSGKEGQDLILEILRSVNFY
ncbi:MAG: hypothetical protein AAB373_06375 [Patescibacteria group bacterium]